MARGLLTITNVASLGGSPTSYRLTVSAVGAVAVNDHIGALMGSNAGAIYKVTAVDSPNIDVIDNLTEAETGEFGAPVTGDAAFGTPEPNANLTQLPFDAPGWDAMVRRNTKLSDNRFVSLGAGRVFYEAETNGAAGNRRVRNVGGTGNFNFNFRVPGDFGSLISLKAIGIIRSSVDGSGKQIALSSSYGAIGESAAQHTGSNTPTYDFTGLLNKIAGIDISSVFASLAAGDYCGVNLNHQTIGGGGIDYLGIELIYNRA